MSSPDDTLIVSGVIVGVVYSLITLAEARRTPLWFTPTSILFLFFTIEMGPSAIYAGIHAKTAGAIPFGPVDVPPSDLATGYLIALIGMLAMHAGLELLRPRPRQPMLPAVVTTRSSVVLFTALWVAGVIITWRPRFVGPLGVLGWSWQSGALAAMLTLAVCTPAMLHLAGRKYQLVFAIGSVGLVLASVFSENTAKSTIMISMLPFITLLVHRRRLRKWLPAAAAGIVVAYLAFVAPVVNRSRTESRLPGFNPRNKLMEGVERNSVFSSSSKVAFTIEQLDEGLMRMYEIPLATGFIVGEVERTGLQYGGTMEGWYYGFVPRVLWPDKPWVTRGDWFTAYLGLSPRAAESTTSTGITAFGEWYWNFGFAGELAGMFAIGVLFSGLWRLAGYCPIGRPLETLLYVAVMLDVIGLPDAITPMVTVASTFVVIGGLIVVQRRAERRRRMLMPYSGIVQPQPPPAIVRSASL